MYASMYVCPRNYITTVSKRLDNELVLYAELEKEELYEVYVSRAGKLVQGIKVKNGSIDRSLGDYIVMGEKELLHRGETLAQDFLKEAGEIKIRAIQETIE